MIVEYLVKIFIILSMIVVVGISYNTFVHKQKKKLRWFMFAVISVICGLIGFWLLLKINLKEIAYVKSVVGFVDTVVFSFLSYVPVGLIILWFSGSLLIAWVYYLIKSSALVVTSRVKFNQWKKQNKDEVIPATIVNFKENKDSQDMQEEQVQEDETREASSEESIHFLEAVETSKIRYDSILGFQRTYEVAKKKGLQIGETASGYVAVYASEEGKNTLRNILDELDIKSESLVEDASVVFFNKTTIKSLEVKKAREMLKAGEKID